MKTKYSIKQILLSNQTWWNFYQKHQDAVRHDILVCIVKLISCKNQVRGYREYTCSNINCSHKKIIPFTCKSKACSSCGKKATEVWLNKQKQILPNTSWQHITFTMPSILWDFFWHNRYLLNIIGALAVDCIKTITNKKKVKPGIFIAIHTFGRDLKRNVHIHLSTTNGGITATGDQWKKVFFHQGTLMKMWRYKIIDLFRKAFRNNELNIPALVRGQLNHTFTFNDLLNQLYKQSWVVYCSKPTNNYKQIVEYLSRYIKRPTIAESKLRQ